MRRFFEASSISLVACQALLVFDPHDGTGPDAGTRDDGGVARDASPAVGDGATESSKPQPPNDGGAFDGDPFCTQVADEDHGDNLTTVYCSSAPELLGGTDLGSNTPSRIAVDFANGFPTPPSLLVKPPPTAAAATSAVVRVNAQEELGRLRVRASVRLGTLAATTIMAVTAGGRSLLVNVDATGQVSIVHDGASLPVTLPLVAVAGAWDAYELVVDGTAVSFGAKALSTTTAGDLSAPLAGAFSVEWGSIGSGNPLPEVGLDSLSVSYK